MRDYDQFDPNIENDDMLEKYCKICMEHIRLNQVEQTVMKPPSKHTASYKKVCEGCGEKKDRSKFNHASRSSDGLTKLCSECKAAGKKSAKDETVPHPSEIPLADLIRIARDGPTTDKDALMFRKLAAVRVRGEMEKIIKSLE